MAKNSSLYYFAGLSLMVLATIALYWWFKNSPYFESFSGWAGSNVLLLAGILVFVKITGIIWPPLPGGVFTIASIPILGWFSAYLVDFIGILLGSSLAYFLGKRYGFPFLQKLFGESMVQRVKNFKVREAREVESVFLLRLLGGGVLVEIVSYASGLLKIRFSRFLLGSVLSHVIIGVPFFYFIGSLLDRRNILLTIFSGLALLLLIWKFKDHYLE